MVKKAGVIVTLAALIGMILLCRAGSGMLRERIAEGRKVSARPESREDCLVIIDPGHGGLDAGKIGVNGKEEKEINLNISLKIQKLLKEQGVEVEMTRTEDERLGETQVEDLKARVSLMNEKNPDLVISIHQNSYHEESVSGAQVFYYTDSAQSERAAEFIQEALKEADPENTKKTKENSTYYILKRTEVPAVIVECGFLSNRREAEKLAGEEYQQELAAAVVKGTLRYLED